jgi:hypothetical protein
MKEKIDVGTVSGWQPISSYCDDAELNMGIVDRNLVSSLFITCHYDTDIPCMSKAPMNYCV